MTAPPTPKVDPLDGVVIDHTHPLHGQCIAGKVLAIPSGRGSCTGSQVRPSRRNRNHAVYCSCLTQTEWAKPMQPPRAPTHGGKPDAVGARREVAAGRPVGWRRSSWSSF
jgi:hypothetical protein